MPAMPGSGSAPSTEIFRGDNLAVMETMSDSTVDLVYLDPPFNTARDRTVELELGGERRSFTDCWESIEAYLDFLRPRLPEAVRLLRDGGSLFIHCDWRTSHYLRVEADDLLGYESLVNEIIWRRHNGHNDSRQGTRHFGRIADTILFYGKGDRRVWQPTYRPYDPDYVDRTYRYVESRTGRRYALSDLSGPGGTVAGNPVFEFKGVTRAWRHSKERLQELDMVGEIVVSQPGGVPRRKRYLDEMPGYLIQCIWDDIPCPRGNEIVHYPTQKPLALLKRIILATTIPGEIIFDPFCGSGTSLLAAAQLRRQAIGIDASSVAVELSRERIAKWTQNVSFTAENKSSSKITGRTPSS